jgi:hypothetical protein
VRKANRIRAQTLAQELSCDCLLFRKTEIEPIDQYVGQSGRLQPYSSSRLQPRGCRRNFSRFCLTTPLPLRSLMEEFQSLFYRAFLYRAFLYRAFLLTTARRKCRAAAECTRHDQLLTCKPLSGY